MSKMWDMFFFGGLFLLLLSKSIYPREGIFFGTSISCTLSCQQPYQKQGSSDVLYIKAKACFQTWQHRGTLGNEADRHTGNMARCAHKLCSSWNSQCRDTLDWQAAFKDFSNTVSVDIIIGKPNSGYSLILTICIVCMFLIICIYVHIQRKQ